MDLMDYYSLKKCIDSRAEAVILSPSKDERRPLPAVLRRAQHDNPFSHL
jgi:hypothetical protein